MRIVADIRGFFSNSFVLLVFVMGLLFLGWGLHAVYRGVIVDYSAAVPAVVTQAREVVYQTSPDRPPRVKFLFHYTYTYADRTYTSKRYSYGGAGGIGAVRQHVVGDDVTAYVNPDKPQQAVLVPGVSWLAYLWIALGVLISGQSIVIYQYSKLGDDVDTDGLLFRVQRILGPLIGLTILIGGIGFFLYALFIAATTR